MTIADCPKYIKIKIKPETLAPGERGEIQVTFDSKLKNTYGTSTDNPKISMKFSTQVYNGTINVIAKIVEDFSQLSAKELADAPVIHFPRKSINVGEIDAKQSKRIEIEFENRGNSKLLIRNIEINNSSLTLAEYDKELKPGRKGKLTLNTNPANIVGKLNVSVTVISNDPKKSQTTLHLYGTKKKPEPAPKKVKNIQTKIKNFKVREAYDLLHEYKNSDKLVVLDVRTPKEYENGCIPEALNFDFEAKNFIKTIQLLDRSRIYLVYCQAGIRSEEALIIMSELGLKIYITCLKVWMAGRRID